jgi:uncharacterized protein
MGERVTYEVILAKNQMVAMRDGVRLATDIYRPGRGGEALPDRGPVLLGRTAYGKASDWLWVEPIVDFFVPRGYVVVLQDIRGRGWSEGVGNYRHCANAHEGEDGYDTVEWIAAQPWSNGRVGTVGASHGAITQQVMALHRPPHLTTIWPEVGPTNNYAHHIREGGAMRLMMFGAQFLHAHDAPEVTADPVARQAVRRDMERMRELVCDQPFDRGQTALRFVPSLEANFFDYYWRGEYDEYWQQECNDQERHFGRHADIPAVFAGGWYDPYSLGTTTYFSAMAAQNSTPQRLLMGPWTHEAYSQGFMTFSGDVEFGDEAGRGLSRYNERRLRWFDHWLRGKDNEVENDPPVEIFVMGGGNGRRTKEGRMFCGGHWRAESEWPLARTQYTRYFLSGDGSLSTDEVSEPDSRSFTFDPHRPVPSVAGGTTGFYEVAPAPIELDGFFAARFPLRLLMRTIVMSGAAHQREAPGMVGARPPYPLLSERQDVLVFETALLRAPVEITGHLYVDLWVASSAVDTDFTAKLVDVYPPNEDYPDGYHMNLVDSIMRMRYRDSWEKEGLMTPGEIYRVRIVLPPTSNVFGPAHRIRLDVSSSNFPLYEVNPNTGEAVGRHTHCVVATNTVHMGGAHPSHVCLPVIPKARW